MLLKTWQHVLLHNNARVSKVVIYFSVFIEVTEELVQFKSQKVGFLHPLNNKLSLFLKTHKYDRTDPSFKMLVSDLTEHEIQSKTRLRQFSWKFNLWNLFKPPISR